MDESDVVSLALRCLHSKATEDHKRALDIVEKLADDDPIACDLLRYESNRGIFSTLSSLARALMHLHIVGEMASQTY